MFPYDARSGVLSDLSIGLRAIVCQRLIRNRFGSLQPAVEILLNTSLIADLVKNGEIAQIKEAMEQSLYPGSQTFEQSLCRLYLDSQISYDEAMAASDSPTNLAWLINQNSPTRGSRRCRRTTPRASPGAWPATSPRCTSSPPSSTAINDAACPRHGARRSRRPARRAPPDRRMTAATIAAAATAVRIPPLPRWSSHGR